MRKSTAPTAVRRTAKPAKRVRQPRAARNGVAASFRARAAAALARGEPDAISDDELSEVMAAAVKLYAAKVERRGSELKPFPADAVTATETVVAACAMIRAADLNLFDVAMWFHRAPRA
jgi:hypothetical protein